MINTSNLSAEPDQAHRTDRSPSTSGTDDDTGSMKLSSHRRSVDAQGHSQCGMRFTSLISLGRLRKALFGHLPSVHPALDPTHLQVLGHGPVVDAELRRPLLERTPCLVAGDELIHVDHVQSALNGPPPRV